MITWLQEKQSMWSEQTVQADKFNVKFLWLPTGSKQKPSEVFLDMQDDAHQPQAAFVMHDRHDLSIEQLFAFW